MFFYGSAPPASQGWMGRAIVQPGNEGGLRGSDQIQAGRAGTWSQPGLIAEVRLKHAQTMSDAPTQSCWPSAEIQARMERGQSAEEDAMFHVKQFLFLPIAHVNHSSEITDAAHFIPPPACHSDAPTRSCCQRRISQLQRPTHPPRAEILRRRLLRMTKKSGTRESAALNEESFQEKQNEITIVSRETSFRPPLLCLLSMRD